MYDIITFDILQKLCFYLYATVNARFSIVVDERNFVQQR